MNSTPLRLYLMGQESLLIHCAERVLEQGHQICGVVTKAPRIVEWAEKQGIAVIEPGKGLVDRLSEPFDYFFSITNFSIVPNEVIAKAAKGAVNFHDGPLPRYAGLNATSWALLHQESSHGITWHAMTQDVDGGDILEQRLFDIGEGETSFSLNTKCYGAGIESFAALLTKLADGTVAPQKQPASEPHYFGRDKRPTGAASLRFTQPAAELEALVRALDFGPVDNPLGLPKLVVDGAITLVTKAEAVEGSGAPGTILAADLEGITVATSDGALRLLELKGLCGSLLSPETWLASRNKKVGDSLPSPSDEICDRVLAVHEGCARWEGFWAERLESLATPEIPYVDSAKAERAEPATLTVDERARGLGGVGLLGATLAYLARLCDAERLHVAYRDAAVQKSLEGAELFFSSHVPLEITLEGDTGFDGLRERLDKELARVHKRGSFPLDTALRHPALSARAGSLPKDLARVVVELTPAGQQPAKLADAGLTIAVAEDGSSLTLHAGPGLGAAAIATMLGQLDNFVKGVAVDGKRPLAQQSVLSEEEQRRLLVDFNATAKDYPKDATIHSLFEAQVAARPDAPALAYLEEELSYRELDARANRLAHHLRGLGVGPDVLVGVCVERSTEMLVATLGIMKAGGGYVPMDPEYPAERLAIMLEDSKVPVLITQERLLPHLPETSAQAICIDRDWPTIAKQPADKPAGGASPSNIAYTIYTSGSTGRPKGVMVEHRNAVSFFAGMDDSLGQSADTEPGVWLAVTSLSFDISVLELFWTLARGFKVVLHADKADDSALARQKLKHADKSITFSLMYFASDEGENESSRDKYKLLLEGAKFGDKNGFVAVWTPERHFHAFGGLYPNPSVASAALATITEKIQLRAASVVAPLHNPIRIAEEWSLVDNLSNGRVGISFAAGWQPNDFIIYHPERFEQRKDVMMETIDTVRRLWRGEKIKATSPLGKEIEVQTLPRPVQKELPFWVTAAGNPETFRAAGESGAHMLTHLLGQSVEEVAEKIKVYRKAWDDAGHPGRGLVTVMLHTFVGDDEAMVKETVREPMKEYLKSSLNLIKLAAWTFPTFKQKADATGKTPAQIFEEEELSPEDMDTLLEHSFERYYVTSGLFGTPESCLAMIDQLKGIDVDDVGCLLDYGVPSSLVLAHLAQLNQLKDLATKPAEKATADYSLAAQIERHGVTHMQCTPSQITFILGSEEGRVALGKLKKIMVGGEAFPAALARELRSVTDATIINMYGPTETTIWSSTQVVKGDESNVPIGRPIANTQLFVLDKHRQPVPAGVAGELYIGGDGVVRGYHGRLDLTAERFVDNPWRRSGGQSERMYRTGDLVRHGDGVIEFLGRVDFQVKIRGYRIELGEIEAHLSAGENVREAVVIAREDVPGDKRLVAYLVAGDGDIDTDALRDKLKEQLPPYMVPQNFVVLPRFPLTPNKKIDRKALPAPDSVATARKATFVAPSEGLEATVAAVWAEVLNVKQVGLDDNFFDLGGHSLLTVQVHRRLKEKVEREVSLTDLFRFPTIRSLVTFLQSDGGSEAMDKSRDRAAARKAAMDKRAQLRDRRRRK